MGKNIQYKVIYERTVRDTESGTIPKGDKIKNKGAEPEFVKLYLDCVAAFKGLSKSLNPILLGFLHRMTYAHTKDKWGGQIIYTNAQLKKDIAAECGVTLKRVEQAITDFVKADVFRRVATGTYQVNACLFGRGDWIDIQNIRATFDFATKTINAEIITENQSETTTEPTESNESQEIPAEAPKKANTAKKTTEKDKGKATTPKAPKKANKERKTTGQNKKQGNNTKTLRNSK